MLDHETMGLAILWLLTGTLAMTPDLNSPDSIKQHDSIANKYDPNGAII